MKTTMSIALLTAGLTLTIHSQALAQSGVNQRLFLDLNAGVQTLSPVVDSNSSFTLFGETAAVATRQDVGTHPIFDVRLGYRISRPVAIAFALSGFEANFTGEVAASIPSPIIVGRPATVRLQTEELSRRDLGYHVQAVWFLSLSDRVGLALSGGPSFIHVQQPVVNVVPVAGTQNVSLAVTKNTGIVKGGNAGIDATYSFSDRYGVGVFVRYVGGSADFADVTGVTVRSVQTGAGLRLRF